MAAARERFPDGLHTILKSALGAAAPAERPTVEWHLGGPRPVCPARGQITLTLALAARHAAQVAPEHRRQFDQVLGAVERFLQGRDGAGALRSLAGLRFGSDLALGLACNAAGAAATLARGKADLVHTAAQAAAAKAVKLTLPAARAELLERIDQELVALECEAAFAELGSPERVARVLWRGADEKGKPAHWVARLDDGTMAARLKLKRGHRAQVHRGTLDEVLASVPEALFTRAVTTAMAQASRPAQRLT